MSQGILVDIEGQLASWCIGSFLNWLKSERLNPTIKGIMGVVRTFLDMVLLDVTTRVELEPTRGWVHAPVVGPDMVMICSEGVLGLDEESNEPGEELVWGLDGL